MAAASVDSARSYPAAGYSSPQIEMGMVNTETRLGEDVLSRRFVKELEHYYDKADVRDKAKCLELITSVRLGEELQNQVRQAPRPKTAMPAFDYTIQPSLNPYSTSYDRDYPYKVDGDVRAIRPMTSDGYATSVSKSQPLGPTTYDVEYARKFQKPATPERIGTASGNRNNKPHPPKSFMVWKFPKKNRYAKGIDEPISEELTNQKLNQITKRLCHSVYQNDYLGIPQGFQVKSAFNLPPDWKDNVGYDMDSIQRESYQMPIQQRELILPTKRYASNFKKSIPAVAVVPTANRRLIGVNTRTTYDRHYNDNAGPVAEQIRDVGRKLGAEALKKYYNTSIGTDQNLIGQLLEEYGAHPSPKPPSYDRPGCPSPPSATQNAFSSFNRSPLPSQRNRVKTPISFRAPSSKGSRVSSPAYKPRPAIPAATAITMPHNSIFEEKMPTTPPSAPYSPPMFLS